MENNKNNIIEEEMINMINRNSFKKEIEISNSIRKKNEELHQLLIDGISMVNEMKSKYCLDNNELSEDIDELKRIIIDIRNFIE